MKNKSTRHEQDPQPPELRQDHYPSLKRVWKGWAIGIGIVLIIVLIIAIVFHATDY